jgi:Asp-tRNA(Asn)/Glu-tRNA(Gln) amidotransferase A subunit family amidase
MTMLVEQSAVELRRRIAAKEISPVELLEACIDRIAAVNPAVNAVTATCYQRARQEAKAAEAAVLRGDTLGLLHGLPAGIKDLEDIAGLLTTYGSPNFRGHVPAQDGAVVSLLRQAGAIVVAKTNVPEMGAGANTRNGVWGATGNPFDPMKNAGGSSGGAAAALACDMLPVCTGSDTGGSLRIPAALCGVVGFRPSPGLVPVSRRALGWSPISVIGPMGRTVEEACLQLAATATRHDSDPLSYPVDGGAFLNPPPADLGSLRVGWTVDFGFCPVDSGIRALFLQRMATIRPLFRSCSEITLDMGEADRSFDILRAGAFVAGFREVYERAPETLGPNVRANMAMAQAMTLDDATWAHMEQTRIFRRFQQAFQEVDVILSPVTPVSPFPWAVPYLDSINGVQLENYYRWLALTYVVTLATNPALALPCGVDAAGMPFGLQLTGRFRGDAALLGIARAMETAFAQTPETSRPRPDPRRLAQPTPELKSIVTHAPVLNAAASSIGGRVAV